MNMMVDQEALTTAKNWLREQLSDGPLTAEEVKKRATEAGLSHYRLNQAAREVGIVYEREAVYQGKTFYKLPAPGARREREAKPEQTAPATDATQDEIDEQLLELVAPLRSVLDQIRTQRQKHQEDLRLLQEKEKRITRTLMSIDPDGWNKNLSGQVPERKPKRGVPEVQVSPQRLDTIVAYMRANDHDLTVGEIATGCGYSEPHTYEAIRTLRQQGVVRLTGRNGGPKRMARTWRLDPQMLADTSTPDPEPTPVAEEQPEWEPQRDE